MKNAHLAPEQAWEQLTGALAGALQGGPIDLETQTGEAFRVVDLDANAIRLELPGGGRVAVTRGHLYRTWLTYQTVKRTTSLAPYLNGHYRTPVAVYALALLEEFDLV